MLRGRSEPLRALRAAVTGFDSSRGRRQRPTREAFAETRSRRRRGDAGLRGPGQGAQHADDALAGFHLRRLLNGAKGVRMQLE